MPKGKSKQELAWEALKAEMGDLRPPQPQSFTQRSADPTEYDDWGHPAEPPPETTKPKKRTKWG